MAAGDMVQKGIAAIVGFNGYTLTGYVMNSVGREPVGDIKELRGENNAVTTKLISNPGFKISVNCYVTSGSTYTTMKKGDAISINSVSYMVDSVKVDYSREEATVSIDAIKEDSMTYT